MHINDYFPAHAAIVTASDTTEQYGSILYVGGTGNVVLDTEGGEVNVTFTGVLAGTYLKVRFKKIKAATTATNLKRMWQ
jgi:hypothetical protein